MKRHRHVHHRRASKKSVLRLYLVGFLVVLVALWSVVSILKWVQSSYSSQVAGTSNKSLRNISKQPTKLACARLKGKNVHCNVHVVIDSNGSPLATTSSLAGSYGPKEFHTAYNLPCTPSGPVQSVCSQPVSYSSSPIIAITVAYHQPNLEADLNAYSRQFGLPLCTIANGCLRIIDINGGTNLPTTTDINWGLEESLDVEIVHAICQTCRILVVEAPSSGMDDMGAAVAQAINQGARAISNSWGSPEFLGESIYDNYFNRPGTFIAFASGDGGYGTLYPAAIPNVVAVGGTSLQLYSDGTYANETTWGGSGSGCSIYESAGSWQTKLSNWNQTSCGVQRAIADLSADADPNTGAAVYDSQYYNGGASWFKVGGTSLATPIIAAIYMVSGASGISNINQAIYQNASSANTRDIVLGSNGTCVSTVMCNAVSGYDGPTGLGSLNGTGIFFGSSISSTPAPSATPISSVYSITGLLYQDKNQNGIYDTGDNPYWNGSVYLNGGLQIQADQNGKFVYGNLKPGTYTITAFPPTEGMIFTTKYPVTVTLGPSTSVSIGAVLPPAPVVSNILVKNITSTSATITFTTQTPSTTRVVYNKTKNFSINSNSVITSPIDPTMVTNHSMVLTNLTKGTTYYFYVIAQNHYAGMSPTTLSFKTLLR